MIAPGEEIYLDGNANPSFTSLPRRVRVVEVLPDPIHNRPSWCWLQCVDLQDPDQPTRTIMVQKRALFRPPGGRHRA